MNESNVCIEEDEIDLKELFSTIWNNKFKIIFFTIIVTSLAIVYALSIPNSYKSQTLLVPQTQAKPSLGGLGALAGMAGIDIGGSGGVDASTSLDTLLKDIAFEKYMIKKYDLIEKLIPKEENFIFALNYDAIYKYFHEKEDKKNKKSHNELVFDTYKSILKIISISSDKKSGIINLSAESNDRFLAKELVGIYLEELTSHLREMEMQDVDSQIKYYNQEMEQTDELSLNSQLSQLASGLIQKKVLSKANKYYNVKQLTKPQIAFIKDKSKPKRALIVVVAFITALILSIFMVFFIEFLRKDKE